MITRFRVRNFKALRDVTLDLSPIHLLIGPNDAGKTTILEAIRFLCRSVDVDNLRQAYLGQWFGNELIWRHAPDLFVDFNVSLSTLPTETAYDLQIKFLPAKVVRAGLERIAPGPDGKLWQLRQAEEWAVKTGLRDFAQQSRSHEHNWKLARQVYDQFFPECFARWEPTMLKAPVAYQVGSPDFPSGSGFGLVNALDELLGYDRKLFQALEDRFREFFPETRLLEIRRFPGFLTASHVLSSAPVENEGKAIYFGLDAEKIGIPAWQASDGTIVVLAFLTLLYSPQKPRIILIEQPENHIHPKRLQDIIKIMRLLLVEHKDVQVIMTTHSPYVVDEFSPEEVTLCTKQNDGSVSVRRLSECEKVREQLDVFNLGEIWTGVGDEELAKSIAHDETAKK